MLNNILPRYTIDVLVFLALCFYVSPLQAQNLDAAKKMLLTWDQLGPSFSLPETGGIKVGNERFPIRLRTTVLQRDTMAQIKGAFGGNFQPTTIERMVGSGSVVECHPTSKNETELVSCSATGRPIVDENNVVHESTGGLFGDSGSGLGFFRYGIFVLREFCPWSTRKGCNVYIKDAVFDTKQNYLYLREGTKIKTGQCCFPIGNYEVFGELSVFRGGIWLESGRECSQRPTMQPKSP